MKKWIYIFILVLLYINSAYPGSYYLAFGGFYEHIALDNNHKHNIDPTQVNEDLFSESVSPNVALGFNNYPSIWNGWAYFALEAFINPVTFEKCNHNHKLDDNLGPDWSYGVSFIPGIFFDPLVLGYLRIGGLTTAFKHLGHKTGFQGGVGLQLNLTPWWNIRGEYDFTRYCNVLDGKLNVNQAWVSFVYQPY